MSAHCTRPATARKAEKQPRRALHIHRAHGGAVPIFVNGEVVGSITMSGEPDVIDHALAAEAIRRYPEA